MAKFYCFEQTHKSHTGEVSHSPALISCTPETVVQEWSKAELITKSPQYPVGNTQTLWSILAKLHRDDFPNLIFVVYLALTHPVHTSDCERSFSIQNLTKTSSRNKLSDSHCDQFMRIKIQGGPIEDPLQFRG